jgi:uracil-DNA glycosylase
MSRLIPQMRNEPGLSKVLAEIRACRACAPALEPRPVLRASASARLCIVGQAPGTRVHASGVPFSDPSGVRLRGWLGLTPEQFYDEERVAIIPMGFCFPGQDAKGGDLPPRRECASLWREQLFARLPAIRLTLLIGQYAQAWHLKGVTKSSLTETVAQWRDYPESLMPLPHPSWRNNGWLKANPWFEAALLPDLRTRVRRSLELAA